MGASGIDGAGSSAPQRKGEAYKEAFLQGIAAGAAGFLGSTLADPIPIPGARAASTAGPATVAAVLVAKRKEGIKIAVKEAIIQGSAAAVAAFIGATFSDPLPLSGDKAASVAGPATVAAGIAGAAGITEAEAAAAGFVIGVAAAARADTGRAEAEEAAVTKKKP